MGRRAIAVKGDIARKKDVVRCVNQARSRFGRIDVLVNNAAVFTEGTILDTTEEEFDTTLNINLKGMFLCSQAVAPIMLKQKKGEIINIVSLGGLQPWSQHLPYSVAKAGAVMLTKCMAKSLAPDVRVNGIAPGTIIMEGEEDPALRHVPVKGIPLKKYGTPSDITTLVVYLSTAAKYMTGHILVVDGGRSLLF
jgi:NAD(P)-dependent dehydrogenase (short-subunit alcohol dehydrogenase family)